MQFNTGKMMIKKIIHKNPIDKILLIPGVKQAIDLIDDYCYVYAIEDLFREIYKGEYGNKLKRLIESDDPKLFTKLMNDSLVRSSLPDIRDEWLEYLALEAAPKIGELWSLSESAVDLLADWIFLRFQFTSSRPLYFLIPNYEQHMKLLQDRTRQGINLLPYGELPDRRIYLDVTYLSNTELRNSYKTILSCRKILGIDNEDLREGAPRSINVDKAIDVAARVIGGTASKQVAQESGFKIYTQDNPSGSYPLFRKYVKFGTEILNKLDALEKFIINVRKKDTEL
jgi:hypothetical protein